jgi:molybdopterin-guanine dinucleotide biosynthesis protein A
MQMTNLARSDSADITAVILAGGQGRRVNGQDKGLLPLAGKSLIAHVVAAVQPQVRSLLISANRHHDEYAAFGRVIHDAGAGFHGPLAGIAAALAQCDTPWLLTVPVDGPDAPHDLAHRLHGAAAQAGVAAAVVHDGVRREPLFALYRCTLASSAAAALSEDLAVWRWQDEQGVVEVDFSDAAQAFVNLNTLQAFRDWEQRHDF